MTNASQTIWLPPDGGGTRLFCIPYAGAGASIFVEWRKHGVDTAVCPVQLPGRENRLRETAFDRIESLVQVLTDVLADFVDVPFAFYGHSMGGLVAFELCRELRRRGLPLPRVLFVGASRAPQFANPNPPIAHLPDEDFIAALDRRYGGLPAAVLSRPELLRLFLPTLRSDFSVLENYRLSANDPLQCPIMCFGGTADECISQLELDGWREHTTAGFEFQRVEGDHFFLKTAGATLMEKMDSRLRVCG